MTYNVFGGTLNPTLLRDIVLIGLSIFLCTVYLDGLLTDLKPNYVNQCLDHFFTFQNCDISSTIICRGFNS